MMADHSRLTAEFAPATAQAWRSLVERVLGERPFASLAQHTAEGAPIAPLYAPGLPAGGQPIGFRPWNAGAAWDVRTLTRHPEPAQANGEILEDLEGGAASVVLRLDPTGERGVAVGSAADLAHALAGVIPEAAAVGLQAGFLGPAAADWLSQAAKASPAARLNFHMDPLSAFAEAGVSPGPIESHLVSAATVGVRLADTHPRSELFLASGAVIHEAGGGEALELAVVAAAAVAYARALVRAGMAIDQALARITLGLAADADYFLSIAKLRAARQVWARIVAACGAETPARIEARSSQRMLTAKDPWTNMIRLSLAGFAAAVGGADAVLLGAFTDAVGLPMQTARRQSRNIQLVLMAEAQAGRVADPAAGSGYVEALSDQFARTAWALFQQIQARGGLVDALRSGFVQERAAAARAALSPNLVGVTHFPPDSESFVDTASASPSGVDAPSPRLPGPDSRCPPLTAIRLDELLQK